MKMIKKRFVILATVIAAVAGIISAISVSNRANAKTQTKAPIEAEADEVEMETSSVATEESTEISVEDTSVVVEATSGLTMPVVVETNASVEATEAATSEEETSKVDILNVEIEESSSSTTVVEETAVVEEVSSYVVEVEPEAPSAIYEETAPVIEIFSKAETPEEIPMLFAVSQPQPTTSTVEETVEDVVETTEEVVNMEEAPSITETIAETTAVEESEEEETSSRAIEIEEMETIVIEPSISIDIDLF